MMKLSAVPFCGFGVKLNKNSLYAAISLKHEKAAYIDLLFDGNVMEHIEIPEDAFIGDVATLSLNGDFSMIDGYRFMADDKTVIDPYSVGVSKNAEYSLINKKSAAKFFSNDKHVHIPFSDTYIYLASVRGQTMLDSSVKADKGSFMAFEKHAEYINKLGFTSVLLMPIYEVRKPKAMEGSYTFDAKNAEMNNFWGFGPGYHFALKRAYASTDDIDNEFRHMIKAFHDKGMEVLLMMQYDPSFSKEYILDSLLYYVQEFHIDGFRLVGEGIPYEDLINNPFLSKTKLISEYYPGYLYTSKKAPSFKNLGVISYEKNSLLRRFLKGDEDLVAGVSSLLKDNSLFFAPVNFFSDFCGLTLYDSVTYNIKHNEANGEKNTDGTNYNYSWNCGTEGETTKKSIINLRKKQLRNAMLLTVLSQATPLIKAGDECLNTQFGNNNPYCQDNETGWVKYRTDKTAKDFTKFLKGLIAFRKRHSILHQPKPILMTDYISCKVPDMTFHGKEAYKLDTTPVNHSFSMLYCGEYSRQYTRETEESVLILINMHWEAQKMVLPEIDKKKKWKLLYCSEDYTNDSFDESKTVCMPENIYEAPLRSISVFLL